MPFHPRLVSARYYRAPIEYAAKTDLRLCVHRRAMLQCPQSLSAADPNGRANRTLRRRRIAKHKSAVIIRAGCGELTA
jgi:hypothetical protein